MSRRDNKTLIDQAGANLKKTMPEGFNINDMIKEYDRLYAIAMGEAEDTPLEPVKE